MKREVAAGIAGFSVEYVRFQTGRNEYCQVLTALSYRV